MAFENDCQTSEPKKKGSSGGSDLEGRVFGKIEFRRIGRKIRDMPRKTFVT